MKHTNYCPIALAEKGDWSASIKPYCTCKETMNPKEQKTCCGKCVCITNATDMDGKHVAIPLCKNSACECHIVLCTPTPS